MDAHRQGRRGGRRQAMGGSTGRDGPRLPVSQDLGRERAMVGLGKVPMVQYGAERSWPDMTQGHHQGQYQ